MPIFIIMGIIAALQTFQQLEAKRAQQEYEAKVARNNARAQEQQAEIVRAKTELARREADKSKNALKHEYIEAAGTNISYLAAGNVDISSGSAAGLLQGNANRFADDMGEIELQKELTTWEGKREADVLDWQGKVLRSQASFLEQTAGSLGQSLLMAGLSGFSAGASSAIMAGAMKPGMTTTTPGGGGILSKPNLSYGSTLGGRLA